MHTRELESAATAEGKATMVSSTAQSAVKP